jgi:hypothetical protein
MEPKKKNSKVQQFEFSIKSIKERLFCIDESIKFDPDQILIGLFMTLKFRPTENELAIEFEVRYVTEKNKKNIILKIIVLNIFEVTDLKSYQVKELEPESVFKIPDDVMINLVGLSISHTRSLIAKGTNGTNLESIILPVIDAEGFLKSIHKRNKKKLEKVITKN